MDKNVSEMKVRTLSQQHDQPKNIPMASTAVQVVVESSNAGNPNDLTRIDGGIKDCVTPTEIVGDWMVVKRKNQAGKAKAEGKNQFLNMQDTIHMHADTVSMHKNVGPQEANFKAATLATQKKWIKKKRARQEVSLSPPSQPNSEKGKETSKPGQWSCIVLFSALS